MIIFNIDVMMAKRKMSLGDLAKRWVLLLKTGEAKAIKNFPPLCLNRFYSVYLNGFRPLLVREASKKNRQDDNHIKEHYPLIWQEGKRSRTIQSLRKTNF